jgi:hypothetical protein
MPPPDCKSAFQEVDLFLWERHLAAILSWLEPGFRWGSATPTKNKPSAR